MVPFIIAGAIALLVIALMLGIYNRFVRLRNTVQESWRDIDAELERRYDLIPNLVNTVKGSASRERGVLDSVTSLLVRHHWSFADLERCSGTDGQRLRASVGS